MRYALVASILLVPATATRRLLSRVQRMIPMMGLCRLSNTVLVCAQTVDPLRSGAILWGVLSLRGAIPVRGDPLCLDYRVDYRFRGGGEKLARSFQFHGAPQHSYQLHSNTFNYTQAHISDIQHLLVPILPAAPCTSILLTFLACYNHSSSTHGTRSYLL